MSELIDRLDKLPRGDDVRPEAYPAIHKQFMDAYPDLRALVLRLEEERDRLQGDVVEKDAIIGPLIEKAKQFEAERDALENDVSVLASELKAAYDRRDALLEALKSIARAYALRGAVNEHAFQVANEAIAKVEGRHE